MPSSVQTAREFALAAHGSQPYGQHPYVYHLDAVAELLAPFGEQAQVAAYLHDTVEDTATTLEEIAARFGRPMADCVAILTDEQGETRSVRKAKTNAKLAATSNTLALTVKAADRLANLLECHSGACDKLEMYRQEQEAFRKSAWRDGLCDDLWQRIDGIFHQGQ
ncbi:HD domain-containing protein [Lignipirellula cremea]|uniref:Bifunctional (P)ppGpp synthase/hydrolase relA n=1 Tax=Lignipirellula cremea TaxID=2528010 RepID=A0A518E4F6_9BACT|nr:HD domain-containing protein [Lignipirellula cremea]QDU98971.1 Bifunctional (p)ppGpp synthase/hydrolase relA [Lignipirellula cremea]